MAAGDLSMQTMNTQLTPLQARRAIDVTSQRIERAGRRESKKLRRRKRKLVASLVKNFTTPEPPRAEVNRRANIESRERRDEKILKSRDVEAWKARCERREAAAKKRIGTA